MIPTMGLYKNVTPVYGKNDKNERVYQGLRVDGKFYKGIRKTGEIPKVPTTNKPKPVSPTIKQPKKRTVFSRSK